MKILSFIIVFCILYSPLAFGQNSSGAPLLWKISGDEGVVGYFMGSIHTVKENTYPLDQVYEKAFEKADVIGFEVNFDSLHLKSPKLVHRFGTYPDGEILENSISSDTYKLLQNRLDSLGLPADQYQKIKPWYMAISLPVIQLSWYNYKPELGMDNYFYQKAKEAGKECISLETVEFQYSKLAELSPDLQEKWLKSYLKNADQTEQEFQELEKAWNAGDKKSLNNLINGSLREIAVELYNKIVVERNRHWIPKMEKSLKSSQTPMFIVGTGHLLGDDSVLAMLKERGYEIERM